MSLLSMTACGAPAPEPQVAPQSEADIVYIEVPVYIDRYNDDDILPHYRDIVDIMSETDLELLAKVCWLEAGNQNMAGQRAVIEVIFNRVLSDKFPNTISGVLYQSGQFTTVNNIGHAMETDAQYEAIRQTLITNTPILASDVYFFARGVASWQTLSVKIGDHCFCRATAWIDT